MLKTFFRNRRELGLAVAMMLILVVLFSPIPPIFLDLAILTNFGLGLTILLLTLYVFKPVEFSTFPSLLLIATLFRLSINVAATRLILTNGDAGDVINAIGTFAVSGNFVVGLVVFFILVVVQYVVVTSGAQRVSEVAARFMLDSMPGQQMSIDADLNMGLIDQKEAIRRRSALEKEAAFYGAMDGASKFVKGDAVAGIIILFINIIAGWIIGVVQMQMAWDEALAHFTLLTIGDGIATQLPALIIAIATGIIVTRSAADKELSTEIFGQLSSMPRILLIVAAILTMLVLLPGMPKWPILIFAGLSVLVWRRLRAKAKRSSEELGDTAAADDDKPASLAAPPLSLVFGGELANAWQANQAIILDRISSLRDAHEKALGVRLPPVRILDGPELGAYDYDIRLFGTRYASAEIAPHSLLAIKGEQTTRGRITGRDAVDPAFGLPGLWIDPADAADAKQSGYTIVDPVTVMITHFGEVVRREAPALLTRASTVALLDEVRSRQSGLVEELIPHLLAVTDVQRVLQNLLSENVSIAAIDLIIEYLADAARTEKNIVQLTEIVRQRHSYAICNKLKERHRDLAVMSLEPRLENQIQSAMAAGAKRETLAIDPRLADRIIRQIAIMANEMQRQGREPVLLCGADIRRQLKSLTRRTIPRLAVLSVAEIPLNIDLASHGIVKLENEPGPKLDAPRASAALELGGLDA